METMVACDFMAGQGDTNEETRQECKKSISSLSESDDVSFGLHSATQARTTVFVYELKYRKGEVEVTEVVSSRHFESWLRETKFQDFSFVGVVGKYVSRSSSSASLEMGHVLIRF